ncbi:hypothetical protein TNCV_5641 [Trichonephila clavipes]|nr:hypothetical protein TNCV_5641 [Trichonephila clavipes]
MIPGDESCWQACEAGRSPAEVARWLQVSRKKSPACGINFKQVVLSQDDSQGRSRTSTSAQGSYLPLSTRGYSPYVVWFSKSPDFNPVEHILDGLGKAVSPRSPPPKTPRSQK